LDYRDQHTQFTYLHLVIVVAEPDSEPNLLPQIYALSNAGIDIDAVDCRHRTALQLAITKRLTSFVTALLRAGADPTTFDYRTLISKQPEPHRYAII
jgi:ankyrin repeat protein